MDVTTMTQMISSVGFPIACCCVMFYQNNKLQETLSSISITMQSMTEKIKDIEDKLGGNV